MTTPAALASQVVRREWRLARQEGVCVVPVFGAPGLDLSSLPGWMRRAHCSDGWVSGPEEGYFFEHLPYHLFEAGRGLARPWLRPETPSLTPLGRPLLRTLEGHTEEVRAVAVLGDGHRALCGSGDYTLRLWDLESGGVIATFSDAAITCVAVARHDLFVAGSANGAVHILRLIE